MGSWYRVENGVALIPMGGKRGEGLFAKIDVGDLALVGDHNKKWCLNGHDYAQARSKLLGKQVRMHRVIMDYPAPPLEIDHINKDRLDNRRTNLRVVTRSTNQRNRSSGKKVGSSSKYQGVCWSKNKNKWEAKIKLPTGKDKYLGRFFSEEEAARAYDISFRGLYPDEVKGGTGLNFPETPGILRYFAGGNFTSVNSKHASKMELEDIEALQEDLFGVKDIIDDDNSY
jgi:hypothetical protein